MSIFKRLFKVGQSEVHSAIDRFEDPIKLTEQGIRDLKKDLDGALKALAEVKALAIRSRNDMETYNNKASDYEKKAMLLVQRASKGEMDASEADRLATESLTRKAENEKLGQQAAADKQKFDGEVAKMDSNIKRLRSQISKYENELKTLKARVKVSKATKNLNKQLAQIDSSGTVSMLERMKEKVSEQEALAESYGDIANEAKSVDEEIDKALEGSGDAAASDALAALKAKMGMNQGGDSNAAS